MNTQISINVNGDPRQILECAYRTLLSMGSIVGDTNPTSDHHLLFANICIQKRYVRKYDFSILIIVRNIDGIKNELNLTIDVIAHNSNDSGKGRNILFMTEFLQTFSRNLQQIEIHQE